MEIDLDCPLDAAIYNHELTVKLKKKSKNMTVIQNGKKLSFSESKDGQWIFINALPGKLEVSYSESSQ